ncbi:MAG: phosphatidylserine decarboxylase family protein [Alphaproteobacteria bacterium GM7ARS4]|nr:phosphatidylserine decarboxylase family protein [Alphaproteobacteria bacterium GM7ARS4]
MLFKNVMVPMHSDGWVFILVFGAVSYLLALISLTLGAFGFVLTLWCIYFFRDPERVPPQEVDAVVSSADGMVLPVVRASPPEQAGCAVGEMYRVSVFMNLFNVHVNRMPVRGVVKKKVHVKGVFMNAVLERASLKNERVIMHVVREDGVSFVVVQVAGYVARRIRADVEEGEDVDMGQRFGIIRFGSRVDIYMPLEATIHVSEGQTAIGGETILASIPMTHGKKVVEGEKTWASSQPKTKTETSEHKGSPSRSQGSPSG